MIFAYFVITRSFKEFQLHLSHFLLTFGHVLWKGSSLAWIRSIVEGGWDLTNCGWDLAKGGWDQGKNGLDLAQWLKRRGSLGSILASSKTVESEGRQIKQSWITYITKKCPSFFKSQSSAKLCLFFPYFFFLNSIFLGKGLLFLLFLKKISFWLIQLLHITEGRGWSRFPLSDWHLWGLFSEQQR